MPAMQILFSVLMVGAALTKAHHIHTAWKQKNKARLKGELLLLLFIVVIGVGLITWQ